MDQSDTPICSCGMEEETAMHLLTDCNLTPEHLRSIAIDRIVGCNGLDSKDQMLKSNNSLILNCSRDQTFIACCRDMVEYHQHLRRTINLN